MTQKRFVYYEHKGADYILDTPNTELDFIEMLGDALETEEIVKKLNELNDENKNLSKLNKILEGFLLDKGYDFKDIIKFVQERTEKNDYE